MSPEQIAGASDEVSRQSDVYSLGIVLYQLLTSRVPFEGDLLTILSKVALDAPEPPSAYRAEIDPVLDALCLRAIAKKPSDRFESMADFATALSAYLKQGHRGESEPCDVETGIAASNEQLESLRSRLPSVTPPRSSATRSGDMPKIQTEKKSVRTAKRRRTNASMLWLIVGALAVIALLSVSAGIFSTLPATSEVSVTIDDPSLSVIMNGRTVTSNNSPASILNLQPGRHTYVVRRGQELLEGPTSIHVVEHGPNFLEITTSAGGASPYGLQFDGLQSRVELPSLQYDGSHEITFEAWLVAGKLDGTVFRSNRVPGIQLDVTHHGHWQFAAFNGAEKLSVRSEDARVVLGQRTHIAGTWDGRDSLAIFVDGRRFSEIRRRAYDQQVPSITMLGAQHDHDGRTPEGFFTGRIESVRLSHVIRYHDQFRPAPILGRDSNTLALFRISRGEGSLLRDDSEQGHDGKLVAASWVEMSQRYVLPNRARPSVPSNDSGKQPALQDHLQSPVEKEGSQLTLQDKPPPGSAATEAPDAAAFQRELRIIESKVKTELAKGTFGTPPNAQQMRAFASREVQRGQQDGRFAQNIRITLEFDLEGNMTVKRLGRGGGGGFGGGGSGRGAGTGAGGGGRASLDRP